MKKNWLFLLIFILSFLALFWPQLALAQENTPNKFGIHIADVSDLNMAQQLINSNGGDWGWVTIVIRKDDLNQQKWQDFMDKCREKHLIPIIRLATYLEGDSWVKPQKEDAVIWADFLGNLNWPVQNQYVVIFNEPNHAKEWGGEINPAEYAEILSEFNTKLKAKNPNFKILNAALDLAAPNGKQTMEAGQFLMKMKKAMPDIFEKLDGWASHSYPNYGFIGKPSDTGKTSIHGYDWELNFLQSQLGLKKNLPIFITETGWPTGAKYETKNTRFGKRSIPIEKYLDENTAANYLEEAFKNVWLKDQRIVAVTPFILNYPDDLFAPFSWLNHDGSPSAKFNLIQAMPKGAQWPPQENKYKIKSLSLPSFLPTQTDFKGQIILQNTGQSIWGDPQPLVLSAAFPQELKVSSLILGIPRKIKPGEIAKIDFEIHSGSESGEFTFTWGDLPEQKIKVLPSSIMVEAKYSLIEKIFLKAKNWLSW